MPQVVTVDITIPAQLTLSETFAAGERIVKAIGSAGVCIDSGTDLETLARDLGIETDCPMEVIHLALRAAPVGTTFAIREDVDLDALAETRIVLRTGEEGEQP